MTGLDYALSKTESLSAANQLHHVQLSAIVNGEAVNVTAAPDQAQLLLNISAGGRSATTRLDAHAAAVFLADFALAMALAYVGIGVKLVSLGVSHDPPQTLRVAADQAVSGARPDLLDRNGEILATDVKTMSVFAEPRRIIDKDEAVELITAVLPDVDAHARRYLQAWLDQEGAPA